MRPSKLSRAYALSQDELARQQRRLTELEKQRAKAKEAYYADAMPLAEFRGEQRRIAREQEAAERIIGQCRMERQELEDAVEEALALLSKCLRVVPASTPDHPTPTEPGGVGTVPGVRA
jgi:chromosome segregation ATPase